MRCLSVCIYSFQWSSSWPQSQQFCGEGPCKETQTHPLKDKKKNTTTHTLILYCQTTNPINYNGSLARALVKQTDITLPQFCHLPWKPT